jgi:hypothetical protein
MGLANYGKDALAGAPIWRAGANVSTRLKTELPLVINGKTVPAGEYSLFIDLKRNNLTFVVSSWAASPSTITRTRRRCGARRPDTDVVRAPMKLETLPPSVEELTWESIDMSDSGGAMQIHGQAGGVGRVQGRVDLALEVSLRGRSRSFCVLRSAFDVHRSPFNVLRAANRDEIERSTQNLRRQNDARAHTA